MNHFNIEVAIKLGCDIKQNGIPQNIVEKALEQNNWFTAQSIQYSIDAIVEEMLSEKKLIQWLSKYNYENISNINVGIIMAGNIPFVGFMDLLTVVVLGAKAYIKPSSKDSVLIEWITEKLNLLGANIKKIEDNSKIDYLIATGSNNANRYFEETFPNVKKILRHSRVSVAVLDKTTSEKQIEQLWQDCFRHFGLGCRNVSHLFINTQFDINKLSYAWQIKTICHEDFIGSYKQQKAILTMKNENFIDLKYALLHLSSALFTPIGCISYSFYDTDKQVSDIINQNIDNIQCVIGNGNIDFGMAQNPQLCDYADNIDVVDFLQSK